MVYNLIPNFMVLNFVYYSRTCYEQPLLLAAGLAISPNPGIIAHPGKTRGGQ